MRPLGLNHRFPRSFVHNDESRVGLSLTPLRTSGRSAKVRCVELLGGMPGTWKETRMLQDGTEPEYALDIELASLLDAFQGMDGGRAAAFLEGLGARVCRFSDGEAVIACGQRVDFYPFVLEGSVRATMTQGGKRRTVARMRAGESFAEAAPMLGTCPVDVLAEGDALVLEVPARALGTACGPEADALRSYITRKKAERIGTLARGMSVVGEPRLEDRILSDLASRPLDSEGWPLLPKTRREWADFLRVDEKTLSRKLREMLDASELEQDGQRLRARA